MVALLCLFTTLVAAYHVDVTIINSLEGKEDLTIHCRSSDDDLGKHLLRANQTFTWGFGANFFGGTKFICSFQWNNNPLLYFYGYFQKRDSYFKDCRWYIRKDGPCRRRTPVFDRCFSWIKK